MLEFARALPVVRARIVGLLGSDGPQREWASDCTVGLLDLGFFRIGGENTPRRTKPTDWPRCKNVINDFARTIAGVDCSAKDVRTCNATARAAVVLTGQRDRRLPHRPEQCVAPNHDGGRWQRCDRRAILLCRSSSRHRYHHSEPLANAPGALGADVRFGHRSTQGAVEAAVPDLLDPGHETAESSAAASERPPAWAGRFTSCDRVFDRAGPGKANS